MSRGKKLVALSVKVRRDGETRTLDPLLPNLKRACSEGIF
jgi:hypothetical protein